MLEGPELGHIQSSKWSDVACLIQYVSFPRPNHRNQPSPDHSCSFTSPLLSFCFHSQIIIIWLSGNVFFWQQALVMTFPVQPRCCHVSPLGLCYHSKHMFKNSLFNNKLTITSTLFICFIILYNDCTLLSSLAVALGLQDVGEEPLGFLFLFRFLSAFWASLACRRSPLPCVISLRDEHTALHYSYQLMSDAGCGGCVAAETLSFSLGNRFCRAPRLQQAAALIAETFAENHVLRNKNMPVLLIFYRFVCLYYGRLGVSG